MSDPQMILLIHRSLAAELDRMNAETARRRARRAPVPAAPASPWYRRPTAALRRSPSQAVAAGPQLACCPAC